MRIWMVALAVILAFSIVVHAENATGPKLCSDTDGGGVSAKDAGIKTFGQVKYGIIALDDTCLTSAKGVMTNESIWLKEYYCENDQRVSKVYDCTRYGYQKCASGACVGGTGTNGSTGTGNQTTGTTTTSLCGNKKLDKSEECDPPGKICFSADKRYGICNPDCTCKVSGAAKAVITCGDGAISAPDEECEADKDCPTNYVCSSCKCVKQLTPEEIAAMTSTKNQTTTSPATPTETTPLTNQLSNQVDLAPKNFSETTGMGVTSGIVNFFKSIFGWISGLFS